MPALVPLAELAHQAPLLIAAICFIFAAIVGSFLNVVIYRLPVMMQRHYQQELAEMNEQEPPQFERFNLIVPSSRCGYCNTPIRPWWNIPILGWLLLRGKTACCHQSYSIRYPLIELLTAVLSLFLLVWFDYSHWAMATVLFSWLLICLTFIDFDHYLLPDVLNYLLLWSGLLIHLYLNPDFLPDSILGAAIGYLSLWSVYWVFKLLTGKEGMGFGDFKLLAALGAWMGWQMLPLIILLSSFVGAVIGIALIIIKGRDHQKPIPFGPYLAIAGWVALVWGDSIVSIYLTSLGY